MGAWSQRRDDQERSGLRSPRQVSVPEHPWSFTHIAVIGTGYVGLVAGACLAETGNDIVCADIDSDKIALLDGGHIPIYEPGLESLVERNLRSGRLRFTTDIPEAVRASAIIFIAVGTPPGEDGSADLQHVLQAARASPLL